MRSRQAARGPARTCTNFGAGEAEQQLQLLRRRRHAARLAYHQQVAVQELRAAATLRPLLPLLPRGDWAGVRVRRRAAGVVCRAGVREGPSATGPPSTTGGRGRNSGKTTVLPVQPLPPPWRRGRHTYTQRASHTVLAHAQALSTHPCAATRRAAPVTSAPVSTRRCVARRRGASACHHLQPAARGSCAAAWRSAAAVGSFELNRTLLRNFPLRTQDPIQDPIPDSTSMDRLQTDRTCYSRMIAYAPFVLNLLSSTALILLNKHLMQRCNFDHVGTLAALHMTATWAMAWCYSSGTGRSSAPILVRHKVFFLAASNTCHIAQNLSLMLNHVGVYQICKIAILPMSFLLEYALFSKRSTTTGGFAMLLIVVGAVLSTVSDVSSSSWYGAVAAGVGALSSAVNNVACARYQQALGMSSSEFVREMTPIQIASLWAFGPALDRYGILHHALWRWELRLSNCLGLVFATCFLAGFVNISFGACLKAYSATGTSVLGNAKTLLVLALGWMFHRSDSKIYLWRQYTGAALAFSGMLLYETYGLPPADCVLDVGSGTTALMSSTVELAPAENALHLEVQQTMVADVPDGAEGNNNAAQLTEEGT